MISSMAGADAKVSMEKIFFLLGLFWFCGSRPGK